MYLYYCHHLFSFTIHLTVYKFYSATVKFYALDLSVCVPGATKWFSLLLLHPCCPRIQLLTLAWYPALSNLRVLCAYCIYFTVWINSLMNRYNTIQALCHTCYVEPPLYMMPHRLVYFKILPLYGYSISYLCCYLVGSHAWNPSRMLHFVVMVIFRQLTNVILKLFK